MFYWVAYFFLWLGSKIFFPITVCGFRNIPAAGNVIIASNHVSYLDPVILGLAYRRRTSYLAKDSLFKNKIFGFILRNVSSAFPIKRETADIGALREALKRLKRKDSLVVFPEGTRKTDAGAGPAHEGIGFLASKSGVPVVPAYVVDSEKVLPVGAKWFTRGPVKVIFGEPLIFRNDKNYQQIALRIMQRIQSLSSLEK
jgi:1-acyl-sn-glycerol-3-phosphate acyltransferase